MLGVVSDNVVMVANLQIGVINSTFYLVFRQSEIGSRNDLVGDYAERGRSYLRYFFLGLRL